MELYPAPVPTRPNRPFGCMGLFCNFSGVAVAAGRPLRGRPSGRLGDLSAVMRHRQVDIRADRHDTRRVHVGLSAVIALLDAGMSTTSATPGVW